VLLLIQRLRLIDLLNLRFDNLHASEVTQIRNKQFFGFLLLIIQPFDLQSQLVAPRLPFLLDDEAVIGVHATDCDLPAALKVLHIVHLLDKLVHRFHLSRQSPILFFVRVVLLTGLL